MEPSNNQSISYQPALSVPKRPLSERVNLRMIIFAGVLVVLLGWPIFAFVSESVTHGIHSHGGFKEVNLKALGQFDFDPRKGGSMTDVPAEYRALDGQKVLLEGEIYAPTESGNVTQFQLVYSIQKCCFNGPPRVQERVFCSVPKGKSFKPGEGYNKVFGTLHVTLKRTTLPDGVTGPVEEVYHLDAESVEQS